MAHVRNDVCEVRKTVLGIDRTEVFVGGALAGTVTTAPGGGVWYANCQTRWSKRRKCEVPGRYEHATRDEAVAEVVRVRLAILELEKGEKKDGD